MDDDAQKPRSRRAAADELQMEILRRMTPQQRLECCFRWTSLTYELARSTIRAEHPDWTPQCVDREMGRRITGIEVDELHHRGVTRRIVTSPSEA
jgi:hypothetical protein